MSEEYIDRWTDGWMDGWMAELSLPHIRLSLYTLRATVLSDSHNPPWVAGKELVADLTVRERKWGSEKLTRSFIRPLLHLFHVYCTLSGDRDVQDKWDTPQPSRIAQTSGMRRQTARPRSRLWFHAHLPCHFCRGIAASLSPGLFISKWGCGWW